METTAAEEKQIESGTLSTTQDGAADGYVVTATYTVRFAARTVKVIEYE